MLLETGINIATEVTKLFGQAQGIAETSVTLSMPLSFTDADDRIWFWQQLEDKFDVAISKAQRHVLTRVGSLVRYLELRLREETK